MKRLLSIILSVSLVLLQAPLSNASLAYALDNDLTQARQDVAKSMGMTLPSTSEELDWDAIESDESIAKDRLVISFMPEVSLDEAQKFVSSKDWKADGCVISWKDNGLKCFAVTLPSDSTLKKCMEQAEASSLVLTVELDAICYLADQVESNPNVYPNPTYPVDTTSFGWHQQSIVLDLAWGFLEEATTSVAVLDTGIYAIPDLIDTVDFDNGYDVVNNSSLGTPIATHGTEVSAVISAQYTDNQGVSGVSKGATVIPINIAYSNDDGEIVSNNSYIAAGIRNVINNSSISNLRVINISFGSSSQGSAETYNYLQDAINDAHDSGVSVVASAGNEGENLATYPSDMENVISVIATNRAGVKADFSTYGSGKDISAPGVNIVTATYLSDLQEYETKSVNGTSFSAPIVSGVLAMMYSINSDLTTSQAEKILLKTASNGGQGFTNEYGYGNVNAAAAVYASKCFDNFERLWGEYALDTMTAISNEAFLNTEQEGLSEGSDYAIVCTMASYYDALSAAGLAGILDCPVLITDSSSLSTQTAQELQRLGVSKVYIAGGLSALSSDVESEIASLDCVESTERIAGENARQTATEIFDEGNTEGTWGDTALITTWRSYYDGLSASSYAYAQKAPLFITNTNDELDSYSLDALEEGGFTKVVILGGTAAVSPTVESQLQTLSTNVEVSRMAGENAYETAKLFAERGLNDGMSAENMCFTTVLSYYDALCASSLAGRLNAPILYADIYTDGSDYSIQAQRFVQDYFVQFEQGYILGGTSALSDNVVVSLTRALLWSD